MHSPLMLIISHRVVTEEDGGMPRTHLIGQALNEARGREAADWLHGQNGGN